MTECIICGNRRTTTNGICHNCQRKINTMSNKPADPKPVKYLHYRGMVAARVPNGNGRVRAVESQRSVDTIPKSRLIDLDHYCDGYTRGVIKSFKAGVLKVCSIKI
jgi:hypothetical protein